MKYIYNMNILHEVIQMTGIYNFLFLDLIFLLHLETLNYETRCPLGDSFSYLYWLDWYSVLQAAGGMADLSDYIRGGAFVLLFLVTGLRDLNTWLLADLIFTGVTGFLLYVNPFWTMNLQVNIEGSSLVFVKR